ncbi:MAG: class I SAM-dependent methyltransferase [Anaerolineae bacterium]
MSVDYDEIASEYAWHRRVHPEVLRSLVLASRDGGASTVLEVGCGTGNYIVALESLAGCSCWGIDPSEEMLSRARERSGNTSFQPGRAERLDFPESFFDLVFSVDVIHHVSNRRTYFREAYRVLKAGGTICTVTDSEWIIRHREPLAAYFPETVEVDLDRYPRISELRDIMHRVGFGQVAETSVEFTRHLTDIRPYSDKAFSSLHLISEEGFHRGIRRMERGLRNGPIPQVSRYLLLWGTRQP